jgi:uncharacterized membrane-anchored protein
MGAHVSNGISGVSRVTRRIRAWRDSAVGLGCGGVFRWICDPSPSEHNGARHETRVVGIPMKPQNLPRINARYWTAIVAASMCGANTGDFASHVLHLGHTRGLLPLALIFVVILWAERRSKKATELYYWLAIIVLRTAATNLADLATHDLKFGYITVESSLTGLIALVVLAGYARGEANARALIVGEPTRNLPATDASYWIAMLIAGTLGTALGDWVAEELGLGVGLGSILLLAVFGIVLLISIRYGRLAKPWYWLSIIAARTAGTTLGDFVASRHGLNLGLPLSTLSTSLLLICIVALWKDRRTGPISDEALCSARRL